MTTHTLKNKNSLIKLSAFLLLSICSFSTVKAQNINSIKKDPTCSDLKLENKQKFNFSEHLYLKLSHQGCISAQYHLAELYFTGATRTPNYPKAKKWFLKAAEQGHGPSQLRLGFLFAENHFSGISPDYAEAEKWFLKAAEQNIVDAQFRLGNFYHHYKKPSDSQKTIKWLSLAASNGHRIAMFDLALILKKEKKMDAALKWLIKAAELDLLPAQVTLSNLYEKGDEIEKNTKQYFFWTLKIAKRETASPFWLNKVADIYFKGTKDTPKNYKKARAFYERSARKGNAHAFLRLGEIYLKGLGIQKNRKKALSYLEKAAIQGNIEAQQILKGEKNVSQK